MADGPDAFAVFDVETTGVERCSDRIISLGVVRLDAGCRIVDRWGTLINPERPMGATHVCGLADDMVSIAYTVATIVMTSAHLPNGSVFIKTSKSIYSTTLSAIGGNPPYKWSLATGSNPLSPGLKVNAKGAISGKASKEGIHTFTVQVKDKKTKAKRDHPTTQNVATKALSITIS